MTDTHTQTLASWLLRQIEADEAAALKLRGTGFARWERVEYEHSVGGRVPNVWEDWRPHPPNGGDPTGLGFVPLSEHIARHDPARVLAQVAAHRAILALHSPHEEHPRTSSLAALRPDLGDAPTFCETCGDPYFWDQTEPVEWPCPTLRALASAYADAPGWRSEWAV